MKANAPESYPMQFRDKIDEYLWKEHHILGGCCSSIENMKYAVAREVAEKLTDAFVEKVINFLNYKLDDVVATRVPGKIIPHHVAKQELIEDFRKYMEGE